MNTIYRIALKQALFAALDASYCEITTFFRLPAKNDPAPPPLGNFADIVYLKEQSFLHRIRDVCTL